MYLIEKYNLLIVVLVVYNGSQNEWNDKGKSLIVTIHNCAISWASLSQLAKHQAIQDVDSWVTYQSLPYSQDIERLQSYGSMNLTRLLSSRNSNLDIELLCEKMTDSVHILDLGHNNLSSIPLTCFKQANIYYLYLTHNDIGSLQPNLFQNQRNMLVLHLEHLNLTDIDPQLFNDLGNLRELSLGFNFICHLRAGVFSSLRSLEKLFINNNKLQTIETGSLISGDALNLQMVDISSNHLNTIPQDCFWLPNLYKCNCDFNNINSLNLQELVREFNHSSVSLPGLHQYMSTNVRQSYKLQPIVISLQHCQIHNVQLDLSFRR